LFRLRALGRIGAVLGLVIGLSLPLTVLAASVDTGHVKAELIVSGEAVPGGEVYVALRQTIAKDWHTYWRNPGDAGQATTLDWTLPSGWSAGEIVWPTPQRLPLGSLMNYGYEGGAILPDQVTVPALPQTRHRHTPHSTAPPPPGGGGALAPRALRRSLAGRVPALRQGVVWLSESSAIEE